VKERKRDKETEWTAKFAPALFVFECVCVCVRVDHHVHFEYSP